MYVLSVEFLREIAESSVDSKAVCKVCGWAATEIERLRQKCGECSSDLALAIHRHDPTGPLLGDVDNVRITLATLAAEQAKGEG